MSSQSVKIQINSLEALERLIGGDSELEIEIRNSVVQNFASKHLKAVAKSVDIEAAEQRVIKSIQSEFCKNFGTKSFPHPIYPIQLTQEIKDAIKTKSMRVLHSHVSDLIKESFNEVYVQELVEKCLNNVTYERVRSLVNEKVKKALEQI